MKTKTPAVSQMTGNFKKAYCRTIEFQNEAGTDTLLEVSPSCSFDGRQWHIHDDEIRLSIHDVGCYDDRTGQWEDNPDVMSSVDGVSWLTFTPHEARQLARELLRFAGKCRTAAEIDRSDPELLERLAESERHIREVWAEAENEDTNTPKMG
ncbi:hypothetical protein [Alistipes sp.]|uniref:hypothetical protein n=3 Tax=Alistipes TaxID=239759 RepID=UPI000E855109|nr:hypothetical protein [Alistipes sp.]HBX89814.1 hypothetical protein [Alistipes sp.]